MQSPKQDMRIDSLSLLEASKAETNFLQKKKPISIRVAFHTPCSEMAANKLFFCLHVN